MTSPLRDATIGRPPPSRGRGPHRLTVLAPTVVDVVTFAGGWLFDQASAGWTVSVLLADRSADRPLRILGAETVELCTVSSWAQQVRHRRFLALSGELLSADHPLRAALVAGLGERKTAVTVWGEQRPGDLQCSVEVPYRLSAAAQVFKSHALAAAGLPREWVASIEVFRSGMASGGARPDVLPLPLA